MTRVVQYWQLISRKMLLYPINRHWIIEQGANTSEKFQQVWSEKKKYRIRQNSVQQGGMCTERTEEIMRELAVNWWSDWVQSDTKLQPHCHLPAA